MIRKTTFSYVLISFILISLYAIFFPTTMNSFFIIVVLAVIFKFVLGINWKSCFKLSLLNYVWIMIFSIFFIFSALVTNIQNNIILDLGSYGAGILWAIFVSIVGIPLTYIILNWHGKKFLPYSLFDKLIGRKSNRPYRGPRHGGRGLNRPYRGPRHGGKRPMRSHNRPKRVSRRKSNNRLRYNRRKQGRKRF